MWGSYVSGGQDKERCSAGCILKRTRTTRNGAPPVAWDKQIKAQTKTNKYNFSGVRWFEGFSGVRWRVGSDRPQRASALLIARRRREVDLHKPERSGKQGRRRPDARRAPRGDGAARGAPSPRSRALRGADPGARRTDPAETARRAAHRSRGPARGAPTARCGKPPAATSPRRRRPAAQRSRAAASPQRLSHPCAGGSGRPLSRAGGR